MTMDNIRVTALTGVQCGFCFDTDGSLETPKSLPCSHIHCLKCLKQCFTVRGIVRCPFCRETCIDPPENLPSAFRRTTRSILCDSCAEKQLSDQDLDRFCAACCKLTNAQQKQELEEQTLQAIKGEIRQCYDHIQFQYIMACQVCYTPLCIQCTMSGDTCTNGSAHKPLSLDELMIKLATEKQQLKHREDEMENLFKKTCEDISEFVTETEHLLVNLKNRQEQELELVRRKYVTLRKELIEERENNKSEMVTFMEEDVGVALSDIWIMRKKIEAYLQRSHEVDIVQMYAKSKDEIQKLLSDEMPKYRSADEYTADSGTWKCDPTMSDSSSDAGVDFYTLPSEKISFHTITPKVSEALSQLCNSYSVKFLEFSHDPDDSTKLTIIGKNAERIPQQEIDDLLEDTGFSATARSSDSLHTDLFLNPTLTVTKKEWGTSSTNAHPWQAVEQTACEVLLHAVNRNKEEPHDGRLAYFAGPAHMLLTEPQREKYGQVDMITEARQQVEKTTTKNRYIVQLQDSTVSLDMGHPPLFCYNYYCCARTTSGCRSCMNFNEKLNGIKDAFALGRAINKEDFDKIKICRHMILNDMILLTLDVRQVHNLYTAFREQVQLNIGPMCKVTHIRQLREISTSRLPIMIGNYPGKLAPMQIAYDRTENPDNPSNPYCYFLGLHVAFTLDSEEHQLNPGDCGHIVFFKHDNGEYQPLGMFIGRVKGSSRVYRAILLHQAIKEMEHDYPHHIRDVQLIDDNFLNGL